MRSVTELTEEFRERGLRVTPQRQAIFGLLSGDGSHPTVEALYERARESMPTISLKTVYQTVHDLEEMGEVALIHLGTGSVRVDPNVEDSHHHLICTSCGKVRDVLVDLGDLRIAPRDSPRVHRRRRRSALPRPVRRVRSRSPRPQPDTSVIEQANDNNKEHITMPKLDGSKTHGNLKEAFAGESQANRRYLYFAQKADVEGQPDIAALFRSVAEGETGHTFGHFDFLAEVGDPVTGVAVGPDVRQPEVRHRGRDLRVHRDVPGLREDGARRGLRRDRRSGSRRSPRPRRATRAASRRASSPSSSSCHATRVSRGDLGGRTRGRRSLAKGRCRCQCTSTSRPNRRTSTPATTRAERDRTFQICSDCRICVRFCPSFKDLFRMIDERDDGAHDVRFLADDQHKVVVDECYQCKLCYVVCPYTPEREQEWKIDFPRLMLRSLAIQAKDGKVQKGARLLARTDLQGKAATKAPKLVNRMTNVRPVRVAMEKTTGISRDRLLPNYGKPRFSKWFKRHDAARPSRRPKVALFPTCLVEYQEPDIGKAMVARLRAQRHRVRAPDGADLLRDAVARRGRHRQVRAPREAQRRGPRRRSEVRL